MLRTTTLLLLLGAPLAGTPQANSVRTPSQGDLKRVAPRPDPAPEQGPTAQEEAERAARELEAVAEEMERIAAEAQAAAKRARARAVAARLRVNELVPATPGKPKVVPRPKLERTGETLGMSRGGPSVEEIHRAANRTAEENKQVFLGAKRASRQRSNARQAIRRSLTYSPGEAPDLGDLDLYANWQWAINIARGSGSFHDAPPGSIARNGHIDYARLTIQPDPGTFAEKGLKWGMRRHNLGDVTVVDCDFTGIPEEHGIYDALSGHALYRGNTFLNLGGQGIQIAHRDAPFQQYQGDNLPYASPPLIILEDNHAVDCGQHASRSGFVWTFFDPGNVRQPGTVILRGCTSVHRWDFTRTTGGDMVGPDHKRAVRSPGGMVVQHYKPIGKITAEQPNRYPTRNVVIDRCLFDFTQSEMPVVAIRGVETVLIEDSCFIARDHKNPHIDIDGVGDQETGLVILENVVSPAAHRVWLRLRGKRVRHVHCPGRRVEIDVKSGEIRDFEVMDDVLTTVDSPLSSRTVAPGIHKQPAGHVDHIGALNIPPLRSAKGR